MNTELRWIYGGALAIVALFGLFVASRASGATFYWTGLLVAAGAVFGIVHLVRAAFDEAAAEQRSAF